MHDVQELSGLLPFSKDACMDVVYTIAIQPHECNAMTDTPNLKDDCLKPIDIGGLSPSAYSQHPPRILILYGSLRDRSFSRLAAEEGGRILERLGAEVRFFNPAGLPLVDDGVDASHPKVAELRELVTWSEGMVWSSPERHGAITEFRLADRLEILEGLVRAREKPDRLTKLLPLPEHQSEQGACQQKSRESAAIGQR